MNAPCAKRLAVIVLAAFGTWALFACFFFRPGFHGAWVGALSHTVASAAAWRIVRRKGSPWEPLAAASFFLGLSILGWVVANHRPYAFRTAPLWPYGRSYASLGAYALALRDHLVLAAMVLGGAALARRSCPALLWRARGGDWSASLLPARGAQPTWSWRAAFWALAALILGVDLAVQPLLASGRDCRWLAWIPLLLPKCFLNAAAEETLYRGALLSAWRRVLPDRWAVLAQALQYGVFHLFISGMGGPLPFFAITAALGVLFGWATLKTGSLSWAIGLHALLDLFPEQESLL